MGGKRKFHSIVEQMGKVGKDCPLRQGIAFPINYIELRDALGIEKHTCGIRFGGIPAFQDQF